MPGSIPASSLPGYGRRTYEVDFSNMRSVSLAFALSIFPILQAQDGRRPIITSHDIVEGPTGGQRRVEELRIFKDGETLYTVQTGSTKAGRRSYRATVSADKMRTLVQILSLPDIRVLPQKLAAQNHPADFFWDNSIQIDRPEGSQSVHIEDFYPFLNLNGLVYPQALIQLECTLQDIKSTAAKRPKSENDWCEDVLSHNAPAGSSYECSADEAQTKIVAGAGWNMVRVGASFKAVRAALGDAHPSEKYSDVHFVEYRTRGIELSVNNSDDTVHAIFFYNHQQDSGQFGVFCGQTDKGVNWQSTVEDVKRLYGQPSADFPGGSSERLVFPGIDFRFENGRLVRIGIPGR